MHWGEKVAEWQREKITIYNTELQFNLIQLNFIAIALNLNHSPSLKYTKKQENKKLNSECSERAMKTEQSVKAETTKEGKTIEKKKRKKISRSSFNVYINNQILSKKLEKKPSKLIV